MTNLDSLYKKYMADDNFNTLRRESHNLVMGEGPVPCNVMIIGEAPGEVEDKAGKPFQGKSGRLLNEWLKYADIKRSECFITNSVWYRPKDNRTPSLREQLHSKSYVQQQVNLVNPKVILTLGVSASRSMDLQEKSYLRGTVYRRIIGAGEYLILPTYHPGALLHGRKDLQEKVRRHLQTLKEIYIKFKE